MTNRHNATQHNKTQHSVIASVSTVASGIRPCQIARIPQVNSDLKLASITQVIIKNVNILMLLCSKEAIHFSVN